MANFNHVTLVGNLTRDPEVRYTPKGSAVCDFSIAVNRVWYNDSNQKQEETTFVDCSAWAKTAENMAKFTAKGLPVLVDGRLQQESWEDKATGQRKSRLKVIAENVQFLAFRDSGEARQAQTPARQAHGQERPAQAGRGQAWKTPGGTPAPNVRIDYGKLPQAQAAQAGADDDIPF